jgi:hypothetical protein
MRISKGRLCKLELIKEIDNQSSCSEASVSISLEDLAEVSEKSDIDSNDSIFTEDEDFFGECDSPLAKIQNALLPMRQNSNSNIKTLYRRMTTRLSNPIGMVLAKAITQKIKNEAKIISNNKLKQLMTNSQIFKFLIQQPEMGCFAE